MKRPTPLTGALAMLLSFAALSCNGPSPDAADLPEPQQKQAADPDADEATAVFAGGCFWCVEAVFEQLEGVSGVVSGYAGGRAETAKYELVASGSTGHAEAVQITYDPTKVTYGELLKIFFATHDPTQVNRQGPDFGSQYRSAIFYADDAQKQAAEAYIQQLEEADTFGKPIATTLEPLEDFHIAEQKHQDFVQRNPNHPYVVRYALPKVDKVQSKFARQIKD